MFVYTDAYFPDSTAIHALYHNNVSNKLVVVFKNDTAIRYDNVDGYGFNSFVNASSAGGHWNIYFRNEPGVNITGEETEAWTAPVEESNNGLINHNFDINPPTKDKITADNILADKISASHIDNYALTHNDLQEDDVPELLLEFAKGNNSTQNLFDFEFTIDAGTKVHTWTTQAVSHWDAIVELSNIEKMIDAEFVIQSVKITYGV